MTTLTSSSFFCQFLLRVSLLLFLFSACGGDYTELDVLLKLKTAMIGPKGSGLDDWVPALSSSSSSLSLHCSFSGVTCDEESRIIALNVSNLPLFGYLPPELGLLNRLVNLTIASDNLTGKLPVEIANLTSLKLFNISNNFLKGRFPGKITLGMTELEIIDIYNNNFSGSLPVEIIKLKNLKHLHLGGNYFSGNIPEDYSEIQSLEYLAVTGNSLTGMFPASLARLKNLKEMYIGYFNSYDGGIPPQLGSLSLLRVLDMGSCNLTGEIPKTLSMLKHLDSLFLQINRLTGQIPSELSDLVSLIQLDLSINELTGEIPESFSELKNLTWLNLYKNNFYGRIPEFIGDLPNLEVLQVWENNFTLYLPKNLGRNGKLLDLDVTGNRLTGRIPPDLCKGGRLKTLILMQNYFFGPIPEELGQCKSLTKMRIMKNFFTGTIPPGIFNLPKVNIIELNDNYFSGELPSKISGDSIGILLLSNNRIFGKIPPAIGNLKNLRTLALEKNRFHGEIPEQVFDLKSLSQINFSANSLSGEIPASISRCSSLTAVDLSQNSLFGEVPNGIADLSDLSILNLSRNHLTGQIPHEIGSMTSLTTLDLSYNNFVGKLPVGGQFNDTSFEGNPNLCLPNHPSCPSPSNKSSSYDQNHHINRGLSFFILIITLPIVFVTTLLFFLLTALYRIRKKMLQKPRPWKLTAFRRLHFEAEDVLKCLKEENIIGRGGAGIVYRGSMPDNTVVAIKQLVGRVSGDGLRSDHGFSSEIRTLGQIRHRYIVRLLGYVSNKETNLLLYEYMPNGSLGELLHGPNGGSLQWEMRYKIALEAAKGLCYLHHDCSPPIMHRDVKSNNILLDSEMEAHVSDFGLAKFLQHDGASEWISSIVGTFGYIAPEYTRALKVDEKSDVYSFGVVLLELIAGRKPVGRPEYDEGVNLVGWVRKTTSELPRPSDVSAKVLAVANQRLCGYPPTGVVRMFKVAMKCVKDNSSARPTMREVVHMLVDPSPTQPQTQILNL